MPFKCPLNVFLRGRLRVGWRLKFEFVDFMVGCGIVYGFDFNFADCGIR